MSAHEAAPAAAQGVAARRPTPERLISLLGLTLALGYLAVLVTAALGGNFLLDGEGRPIANDFVNVWAAGSLALDGNPAAAYDWTLHKAAEVRAVGHDFANYYGWHYPPPFLFVAAALATLPLSRLSSGSRQRSPPTPRRLVEFCEAAPVSSSRSDFRLRSGT